MTFLLLTILLIFGLANSAVEAADAPVNKAAKASNPTPASRINEDAVKPSLSETMPSKQEAVPSNPRTQPREPMRPNDPPNPETPHNTMPNGFPQ